ncbi:MAG: hypothetical protein ACT4P7_22185 [Gemmatimonadaceae bacterium]
MRRPWVLGLVLLGVGGSVVAPTTVQAQAQVATSVEAGHMAAYAKAYLAISLIRDRISAELANPRNKRVEEQTLLRERQRTEVARTLREQGLTEEQYDRITYVISTDGQRRKEFEAALAQLTAKKDER